MRLTDQAILEDIRNGGDEGLIQLYQSYRSEFFGWAMRHFDLDQEACADLFQDCIINLRKNIVKGKLTHLSSTLKTYLFAIGKNMARTHLKKEMRVVKDDELMQFQISEDYITDQPLLNYDKRKFVSDHLKALGEPCFTLLRLFYYDGFSMDSIAQRLKYKNENVAKSQKLRCINALKKRMTDQQMNVQE